MIKLRTRCEVCNGPCPEELCHECAPLPDPDKFIHTMEEMELEMRQEREALREIVAWLETGNAGARRLAA